jgi:hypothetical protein
VSNLILNMNVYMADVRSGRVLLTKSVDLRGNTDDSWSRSFAVSGEEQRAAGGHHALRKLEGG